MAQGNPSHMVKSVANAFELIDYLQDLGGATLTELAVEMDLAKSTVHKYLKTLETLGYVVNKEGTYRLGLRFFTHGLSAKASLQLDAVLSERLAGIARDISAPVWWVTEEFGRGFFLERATVEGSDQIYGRVGKRSYLHTHAPGKAILAELSDDEIDEIVDRWGLPARTRQTTTDRAALGAELDEIRERGVAISQDEAALGVLSVGVGFQDRTGRIHGLGTFSYAREVSSDRVEEIGERLSTASDALEAEGTATEP